MWDELAVRSPDSQRHLPPRRPSLVVDDFGDVFGIFYALTGPDFSDAELYDTAKLLRRELLLVPDVKIEIFGHQQEVIYIELARDRIAQLGIRRGNFCRSARAKSCCPKRSCGRRATRANDQSDRGMDGRRGFRELAHPRGAMGVNSSV